MASGKNRPSGRCREASVSEGASRLEIESRFQPQIARLVYKDMRRRRAKV